MSEVVTERHIDCLGMDRINAGESLSVKVIQDNKEEGGYVQIGDYLFDSDQFLKLADLVQYLVDQE